MKRDGARVAQTEKAGRSRGRLRFPHRYYGKLLAVSETTGEASTTVVAVMAMSAVERAAVPVPIPAVVEATETIIGAAEVVPRRDITRNDITRRDIAVVDRWCAVWVHVRVVAAIAA